MTAPIKQASFSGGEIAPFLYARTDQVKYETGLRTMRNFLAMRHGGATKRPGTQYIATTLNSGNSVRLIPFIFNETGAGQSYVLEFGNKYITFYQNGAAVMNGSVPYKISSPYLQADLATLQFAESADVVTIVHPNYAPRELQRLAATNWVLVPIGFYPQSSPPLGVNISGGNSSLPAQCYAITAVNSSGEESFASLVTTGSAGGADADNPVTVGWVSVINAVSYRIYKTNGTTPDAFGYIATVTGNSWQDFNTIPDFTNSIPLNINLFAAPGAPQLTFTNMYAVPGKGLLRGYAVTAIIGGFESAPMFVYTSFTPLSGFGIAEPIISWAPITNATQYNIYKTVGTNFDVFGLTDTTVNTSWVDPFNSINTTINPPASPTLYNPSTVGYSQQRRYFAATNANPIGFWGSQPGSYYNFNTHSIPSDSDAVFGALSGSEVNSIEHITELKFMLMLTAGAEIYVQGNGQGVVTPSSINASVQSQYGSSPLRALKVSDTLIFNQALGSFIRDFNYDFAINGYHGNDLTVFSSHLFEGYSLVDWDFQKIPDSILWAARSDGVLLGLTYSKEQQILAWHRHDFTNGFVENVCCIPENGAYAVYLCVRRIINGQVVRYVERMSSRIWSDVLNATYLDCFLFYNGTNQGSTTMTMKPITPPFDQSGSAYTQKMILTTNTAFFTSQMVGDAIFISDQDFVMNIGQSVLSAQQSTAFGLAPNGTQIRFLISDYISATEVHGFANRSIPADLQNVPITTWARAVNKVAGLNHLIGQNVAVFADRFLVASPNNQQISFKAQVAPDGTLTLDKHYAVIYVGLPMTSDLQTLDLETSFGETIIGKRKRQNQLRMHLYNSRSLFAGSEDPDTNLQNVDQDPLYEMFELKTGTDRTTYDQPPTLITGQEFILEDTRWNKNGRLFIRSVDPVPLTILAVVPGGDSPAPSPFYERA